LGAPTQVLPVISHKDHDTLFCQLQLIQRRRDFPELLVNETDRGCVASREVPQRGRREDVVHAHVPPQVCTRALGRVERWVVAVLNSLTVGERGEVIVPATESAVNRRAVE